MRKLAALLLLLLMLSGCALPQEQPSIPTASLEEDYLVVHFIDVGQADCALLVCGDDTMLIDGGNAADGMDVVRYLQLLGIDQLDLVVGTHSHEDHIGGLATVLRQIDAETIWTSEITYTNATVNNFLNAAAGQKTPITQPELGDTYTLGDATVTVLGPVQVGYEDVNDLSLVLMVEYFDTRFLFTGDMEQLAEGEMLDYWGEDFDWNADVLKVGHHGSYSSTGYRLLREVAPTWGVISCGYQNEYGHPHDAPLSRLRDAEVTIFRTDLMGTVIAASDGESIAFAWSNPTYAPAIPE